MKDKILNLLKNSRDFVSGQELSEKFGVSRTAVWKAIRGLEEQGYVIEAVRNRGYRLVSEPDLLTGPAIWEQLDTQWAGRSLVVFDEIDSTNNEAKRRAEDGAKHGLLVVSDRQTAGRGRRGRAWVSDPGVGIFMTLLLKPEIQPGNASMLTLVMGMAMREALSKVANVDAAIKWPNDIVVNGKKVCGILTEMSAQIDCINHIVIGTGVNVHNEQFSPEVSQVATSIFLETGAHISRAQLVAESMKCFEGYYKKYLKTENLIYLMDEYNEHLINRDRQVQVLDYKRKYTGIARGINEQGELLVETENGITCVSAGEVSVRGVYGYV